MRTIFLQKGKKPHYLIKQILLTFIFVVLVFNTAAVLPAHAAEEYEVYEEQGTGTVTSEILNIRSGPGTVYDRVGEAAKGDVLTITGQASNGWYRVSYEGITGYVSGKYIVLGQEATSSNDDQSDDEAENDADTDTDNAGLDKYISGRYTQYIKVAVIVLVISIILIMLIITIRGMSNSDDDDYDDEDDYEDDEDDEDDDEYYEPVKPVRKKQPEPRKQMPQKQAPKKLYITEEDYRVHIDPIYFEDEKPVPQPERVNDNEDGSKTENLKKAIEKLNELQEEIERLKK